MEYTISVLTDENRLPELIDLFRTGLGDTSVEHWKWRLFTENGLDDQPFAVIAEDEHHSLVGVSTAIPVYYGYEKKKCILFGDWVVHPEHRGQGLIRKIFDKICEYAAENQYEFMLTFPNQNSYPILKKYGFHDLCGVTCWITKKRLFFSKNMKSNAKIESRYDNITYRYTDSFPGIDEFQYREKRIFKNASFMHWKYDLNPDEKYTWLSIWQGETCIGYFVYLLTKGRLRTAVNVYDWEFTGTDLKYFQYAVNLLKKEGNYVSFWGRYSDDNKQLIKKAGLYDRKANIVCIVKPIKDCTVPDLELTRIDTDY